MPLRDERTLYAGASMSTRKMILQSLLVSIAGVLHFVEAMLALPFPVPGLKLGIANIVSVYAVAVYGLREALAVAFLRVMLGSALAGGCLAPTG